MKFEIKTNRLYNPSPLEIAIIENTGVKLKKHLINSNCTVYYQAEPLLLEINSLEELIKLEEKAGGILIETYPNEEEEDGIERVIWLTWD